MCLPEKNERGNLLNLQEFAFQRVRKNNFKGDLNI